MTEEPKVQVWRAYAEDEETIAEQFAKLAKRAEKLGVPAPTFEVVKRYVTPYRYLDGREIEVDAIDYIIHGTDVVLGGDWQFVGVIDHFEAGNVVMGNFRFPEVLAQFQTAPPACAHCGLNRQRKQTLIIRNAVGEVKQVGVACAKDFFGHTPPRVWELFEQEEFIDRGFNDYDFAERGDTVFPALRVVQDAFRVVAALGFKPTRDADGFPNPDNTRDLVYKYLREGRPEYPLTQAIIQEANDAFAWITELETDDQFLVNLKQVAKMPWVNKKLMGVLVAIVKAYPRFLKEKALAEAKAKADAELTAVVEGRQEIVGTVLNRYFKEDGYGGRYVMLVLDDRGFKVWGTEPTAITTKAGYRVKFTATITAGRDFGFGFFARPAKAEILDEPKEVLA